ncbi:class I SAM-dependent methyltransferase [Candidatus Bathyarchaeota archaeon A05DMB-2]|jgi:2-polyprenyl-3-methyl-5-hydroxy-6-metoxy-1,4-benzoquinol methylase|nr:class I SAM-dependent methyltransferase [Candidatus Bathyarchaeota archaeon A05DMB-2]
MLKTLKKQVQGVIYLLSHPKQLRWIIIRETHYGGRKRSKQQWVEWQKYDANVHISMMRAHTDKLSASELNSARIKIFSDMVNSIGKDLKVLDVGCGDGVLSVPIWKMGNYVASVELPTVATLAKKCMVPQVVACDAEQLAFVTDSFDVVLASEVVEHLWHPQSFLDEAHRVLKAGGFLIVETPEGEAGLNYDSHRHYFTVERLEQMLSGKFTLCEVKRLEATGSAQTPTIILMLRKSS